MPSLTSRRTFLLAGGAATAALLTVRNYAWAKIPLEQVQTLSSIVDTCIPADEAVGALDLGLDRKLQDEIRTKPKTADLVARLLTAIESKALGRHRKAFHLLKVDQREALLLELGGDKSNRPIQRDFNQLRKTLMHWYYSSPEGQAGLDYVLPANYPAYHLMDASQDGI